MYVVIRSLLMWCRVVGINLHERVDMFVHIGISLLANVAITVPYEGISVTSTLPWRRGVAAGINDKTGILLILFIGGKYERRIKTN